MEEFLKLLEIALQTFDVEQSPQTFLALFILTFARFFSFVYIVPFFGGKNASLPVKIAVAASLVVIVFPFAANELPANTNTTGFGAVGFFGLLAKEIFVGFTLGFVASLVFEAARAAGQIADYQRGSAMNEIFAPQLETGISELGKFKLHLAIVVFVTTGAHLLFIGSLVKSFEFIPVLKFPAIETGWTPAVEFLTMMTASVISLGVQLAAPVVVTLLLTDLFFGLINRAAPEINTFFMSLPVKMWLGIFVVIVMLPFLIARMTENFESSFEAFEFMIRFLGGTNP